MKIWLDDIREPRIAHSVLPDADVYIWREPDVIWVTTAEECIRLLETGKVTRISLDFDLGYEGGCGGTVADWIEKAAFEGRIPPLKWSIHSSNPVGRRQMRMALFNADRFWKRSAEGGAR